MVTLRPTSFNAINQGGSTVNRFSSMFSQILKLFPRTEFQALVKRTHAERHARGFSCWGQFVAMLFCQLGRAHSLHEICGDRKSTRLNSSHGYISYAVFCLKKKKKNNYYVTIQ